MIPKIKAAEALAPVLDAFHRVSDKPLRAVSQICTQGSVEKLVFDFGNLLLVVAVDENDDSVDISTASAASLKDVTDGSAGQFKPWRDFIGKRFGWGWLTINQQGYCDGLLLSFGGIVPQVFLNVIASSIKTGTISVSSSP